MHVSHCPRCGSFTLENLSTHSHCWECSYSPESDLGLRMWREMEFPKIRRRPKHKAWFGQPSVSSDHKA